MLEALTVIEVRTLFDKTGIQTAETEAESCKNLGKLAKSSSFYTFHHQNVDNEKGLGLVINIFELILYPRKYLKTCVVRCLPEILVQIAELDTTVNFNKFKILNADTLL